MNRVIVATTTGRGGSGGRREVLGSFPRGTDGLCEAQAVAVGAGWGGCASGAGAGSVSSLVGTEGGRVRGQAKEGALKFIGKRSY